jgi:Kae1-associated kinase Bud32
MEIIRRGAEAEIYQDIWRGRPVVVKRRVRKGYRISQLDESIRQHRTKKEMLLMVAARKAGVYVPIIYDIRLCEHEIVMQYVDGTRIKDGIDAGDEKWQRHICHMIGESVARLHRNGIVHGDLTTSNMFLWHDAIYLIDFGLGAKSDSVEDRGVDMHLLMEALTAAHKNRHLFTWVLEGYDHEFLDADQVRNKIDEIARRGRYMRRMG